LAAWLISVVEVGLQVERSRIAISLDLEPKGRCKIIYGEFN